MSTEPNKNTPPNLEISQPNNNKSEPNKILQIFGGGGGSPGQGTSLNVGATAKVWESDNGRNTIHGTGTYAQHLGGPYGSSKPNFGGGISFTHRF